MHRFLMFVDGSNLSGSLRKMGLRVDDYETFFRHIFNLAASIWRSTANATSAPPAQLLRVYWYELGTLDEWDLGDARAQATLREYFENDRDLKRSYMALAGQKLPGRPQEEVVIEAWTTCFSELKSWYEGRKTLIDGFRRFHFGIRSRTDFIDVIECGHWKVDLLKRAVFEKGLDTRLAVDMVTMVDHYDVALLVSGDADNIPCMDYVKNHGKSVGVVEFLGGYPPEKKGGAFSSRLKVAADFVVQVYEMELVTKGISEKAPEVPPPTTGSVPVAV